MMQKTDFTELIALTSKSSSIKRDRDCRDYLRVTKVGIEKANIFSWLSSSYRFDFSLFYTMGEIRKKSFEFVLDACSMSRQR